MQTKPLAPSISPVPREEVATPEDVRRLLNKTPEEAEELQKAQALQLYRSRARLSPEERTIGRGIELERHYRIVNKPDGLAEALAMQGKYAEAAAVAVSPAYKKDFQEMATAVDSADTDCTCDSHKETKDYLIPNQYVERYSYSQKHRRMMPFVRCTVCKTLNARPMPEHLVKQRAIRHSSLHEDSEERINFFKK